MLLISGVAADFSYYGRQDGSRPISNNADPMGPGYALHGGFDPLDFGTNAPVPGIKLHNEIWFLFHIGFLFFENVGLFC